MASKSVGIIESREFILRQIEQCINYVSQNCFDCNNCWECSVTSKLQNKSNKKGLKTFNKHIKWWSIEWIDKLPILKAHE